MEKTTQTIPFLRLSIAFTIGILVGSITNLSFLFTIPLLIVFLLVTIFINKYYRYSFISVFGISVHLFLISFGILLFNTYNQKPVLFENGKFIATVLEIPLEKTNSYKSVLKMESFYRNDSIFKTDEKVLAYFEKNKAPKNLNAGDKIIFSNNPQLVQNNGNPYEFDYKKYLHRKKIYRQVYLSSEGWGKTKLKSKLTAQIYAEKIRNKLLSLYRTQNLGEEEFEILSALTLGYKRELDPEIKQVFTSAGAMHVLAVSGLHVGIIFLILTVLLGFLKKTKYGRILFVVISITVLWIFAFITGLSPSVMRAATMFSFVIIGNSLKRQMNIYNTLASSAFVLLLINPNNIFEIGFQLSYAAVFGIVFLQPKFQKIIRVKNKILNYFWILLTVSFAAQIATFPISLYYFNQFPTFFWLTNLFVIPAVFFLIPLGILLLTFSGIPAIATIFSFLIKHTISAVYISLQKIEELPYSVQQISIQPIELILIILILFSFFLFLKNKRSIYIKTSLLFITFVFTTSFIHKVRRQNQKQIIIYNTNNLIIHLISGKLNYVITSHEISKNDYDYIIKNTKLKLNLNEPVFLMKTDSFRKEMLFLKNGIIFFEGKLINIETSIEKLPDKFTPHFVVNPVEPEKISSLRNSGTIIISNKRYFNSNFDKSSIDYNTSISGAFQKKW